MKDDKYKQIVRTVGGILFALGLFPFAWLLFYIFANIPKQLFKYLPNYLTIILIIVFFLLLVIVTALSKIYVGGGSFKMILRKNNKVDKEK